MKKNLFQNVLLLTALLLSFASCQKEMSAGSGNPGETPVDLGSKVRSNVSGFVTDENDNPVQSAIVKVGTQTISTDEYGYFALSNVEVSKNAATVKVDKQGYFPGIRTYIASNNKAAFVRIKLLPKTNAGTISAVNGGAVSLPNGLKISLPANAVVNAASGLAYTGTVNVAAQWINPTAADLGQIMPGDLRAIDDANNMKLLITYGMAAVELTDGTGAKLQIAAGQKAKLTLPLPVSIAGSAPASIPLWHFDEAIGLWREEGIARKVGNTYEGDVSHFSFWNCDIPNTYIQLDATIHSPGGIPMAYAAVKISNTVSGQWAFGYTDANGYVQGAVPRDTVLLVEVFSNYSCGTAIHTQTITTGNSNISLGTIVVNNPSNIAYVTGSISTCTNTPVTNGSVLIKTYGVFTRYNLSAGGSFNYSTSLCNATSMPLELIAEDFASGQQSTPTTFVVTTGNNALGNIQACGTTTTEFINMSVNGTPHSFTAPADSLAYYNNNQTNARLLAFRNNGTGTSSSLNMIFSNNGLAVGSNQPILEFTTSYITEPVTYSPGAVVNITEYGAVGEFVAGTFSRTATGVALPNTIYTITGNFRVRRFN